MKYDIVSIGHITNDVRVMMGERTPFVGGAAYFSPVAAARSGAKVLVATKMAEADRGSVRLLEREGIEVRFLPSKATTSIENIFLSPDPDDRRLRLVSAADGFTLDEINALPDARVYHIAALFKDEVPDEAIRVLASRGKVALDLQAVLRYFEGEGVVFRDWPAKREYLPFVRYLKADSVEIKAVCGTDDREEAARMLARWGSRLDAPPGHRPVEDGMEIVITRQDEALAFDGREFFRAPFDPVRLDGRAGRGDTCFLSYIARRASRDVADSIHYAAALTSIKMESPGPFAGTIAQVEERIRGQDL
jgi:sugar/nucleoside kinase (ribokinase family)